METILTINPGSTSTKLAAYADHKLVAEETIRHSMSEIEGFETIVAQTDFRKELILTFIKDHNLGESLVAIVGRGGLLKPIVGGTYQVDEEMLVDLQMETYGSHASNLGGILAHELGGVYHIPAFIVDPVVADEMLPVARISGLAGIERRSVSHVLNQKAVARKILVENNLKYEEANVIVAHLGGGISIGAHQKGKMVDVVNGLDGEGPYSPERSGTLPLIDFAQEIIENKLTLTEVKRLIAGNSGLKSYLNETDLRPIADKIDQGAEKETFYVDGMCYQIAKAIGEMATVLKGNVDYIILTGGVAYSKYIVEKITEAVSWIANVETFPGEMEMEALYEGGLRVLTGEEKGLSYKNLDR
ncbi:butyrate kinase [Vagococcus salmoninarum]|uniref:Probable butyrate kinase n=1 Tax=Vagococcus salmoninarum TaxID=2739 RepID=A0A429ZW20_9ENTE|nr:butyrate kinase [Vagococcus salmoninarum]RST97910.1 butyrate kinase [Vagococcus salmoninarum]